MTDSDLETLIYRLDAAHRRRAKVEIDELDEMVADELAQRPGRAFGRVRLGEIPGNRGRWVFFRQARY